MEDHSASGSGEIVATLLALEAERKTGALDFRAQNVLTRIFVDGGVPVFAEAGVLGETLGHVLVREKIITDDQFAAVLRKMTDAIVGDSENVRFGQVIIELGFLTEQELKNALATQIEKKIIGCVHRGVGDWTFDASRDVKKVAQHAAPIRALLVDAADLLPPERIASLLKLDEETFPCTVVSGSKIADDFGLEDPEVVALAQFDGTRPMKAILVSGRGEIEWSTLLCALVMGGAVELLPQRGAKQPTTTTGLVNVTGRRRAVRVQSSTNSLPPPPRSVSLPPARNEREATLFAEDEFQTGKRLFSQGKLADAHAQLMLAVDRSPDIALYRLWEQFVGSRKAGKFADDVETKKLATQLVKEDIDCAFAYYVLGFLALDEGNTEAAKRFFTLAYKRDPQLLDAGRQAHALEKQHPSSAAAKPIPRAQPGKAAKPAKPSSKSRLTIMLAVVLAVIVIASVVAVTRPPAYVEVPAH